MVQEYQFLNQEKYIQINNDDEEKKPKQNNNNGENNEMFKMILSEFGLLPSNHKGYEPDDEFEDKSN